MVATIEHVDVAALPLAPVNPLPYREQVKVLRAFHSGCERLRDAGGPVTRLALGPAWLKRLVPPVVVATSPRAAHDILSRAGAHVDRTRVHDEMRHLLGGNLFDLPNAAWLPRRRALQPIFTKHHVRQFGGHMAQAAGAVVAGWGGGAVVDLDSECRRLTLRALGRSVFGLDLDARADLVAEPLRITTCYCVDRAMAPVCAPRWLPTPARRRARAASVTLHRFAREILDDCRADPTRDAPLVRALIAATDPTAGKSLSDEDICDELVIFMLAGHDTTSTALTYALWALGCHPDLQDKVRAEVDRLGDRELVPEDVPQLTYTTQVLYEALRLCPPGAMTPRAAVQDIEAGGYRVEAGSMLIVGIYALHRDPALWDDPLTFDPERFSAENSAGRDRWQFLPFGAGSRSCVGDHFAMLEATLALATLVRGTDIESLDPDFPMAVPFTTVAAAPIRARVKARTHA